MIPFGGNQIVPSLDVNNTIYTRQVQGSFNGPTIGLISDGAGSPGSGFSAAGSRLSSDASGVGTASDVGAAAGFQGGASSMSIVGWLIGLIVLLVALMYFAKRYGTEGEAFSNIRLSLYNILVITLAYVIGGNLLKAVFARFRVPGVSELILAA